MSEYNESHSTSRLIGAPPGYVGHDEGGQLTEAVRRKPYSVLLLDEVEKAHPEVLLLLLSILDDGRLTDAKGRTVSFSNCVIVLTSNVASEFFDARRSQRIGFGAAEQDQDEVAQRVLEEARKRFPLELWNRIEERLVFEPLARQQIVEIARLLVQESSERLQKEKDIAYWTTDEVLEHLLDQGGYDLSLGARPLRTLIQQRLEASLAEQILLHRIDCGDRLLATLDDQQQIHFIPANKPQPSPTPVSPQAPPPKAKAAYPHHTSAPSPSSSDESSSQEENELDILALPLA